MRGELADKPKGMHQRTYERLITEHNRLYELAVEEVERIIERLSDRKSS